MVQLTVRLTTVSARAHQFLKALHLLMRHTVLQGGCSNAHIAVDVDEANTFWYDTDWEDVESLEQELRSDRFSQLLALVETSTRPPLLEFRVVSETRGLEYVAALRAEAEPG